MYVNDERAKSLGNVSNKTSKPEKRGQVIIFTATWWGLFGGTTPHLTKIAMRILSLTSSSAGCERNWSTFEGVMLIYWKKKQKRKDRNMEVLLANDPLSAQEWIADVDEVDPEMVNEF
uniref:HAT C-terminal dimerisation domain-containing protein n=1 Tax=Lactuca sativa TaxID=4236 RepID=A0A9R1WNH5_LACSA|nr:hypothetical protein LSAT_V11C100039130 [Lactuca sativa]